MVQFLELAIMQSLPPPRRGMGHHYLGEERHREDCLEKGGYSLGHSLRWPWKEGDQLVNVTLFSCLPLISWGASALPNATEPEAEHLTGQPPRTESLLAWGTEETGAGENMVICHTNLIWGLWRGLYFFAISFHNKKNICHLSLVLLIALWGRYY